MDQNNSSLMRIQLWSIPWPDLRDYHCSQSFQPYCLSSPENQLWRHSSLGKFVYPCRMWLQHEHWKLSSWVVMTCLLSSGSWYLLIKWLHLLWIPRPWSCLYQFQDHWSCQRFLCLSHQVRIERHLLQIRRLASCLFDSFTSMQAKSLMTLFWLLLFYFTERLAPLEEARLSWLENDPRDG